MSKLSLKVRFKDFEIRYPTRLNGHIPPDKYDVVKWQKEQNNNKEYCFSIAFITYNSKNCCCEFESVGQRYLEYREDGLEEWLLAFMRLIEVQKKFDEDYQYPLDND